MATAVIIEQADIFQERWSGIHFVILDVTILTIGGNSLSTVTRPSVIIASALLYGLIVDTSLDSRSPPSAPSSLAVPPLTPSRKYFSSSLKIAYLGDKRLHTFFAKEIFCKSLFACVLAIHRYVGKYRKITENSVTLDFGLVCTYNLGQKAEVARSYKARLDHIYMQNEMLGGNLWLE